jgi:transcription-repair coupling factor (superfamily II helicase)
MRDLEIRGAGNLLGSQQHGFIEEVGFELYIKLLEEAVAQLKGRSSEEYFSDIKTTTDLDLFLPENYIADSSQRVDIYRRFSSIEKYESIAELMDELSDRFGPPPEAAVNLANLAAVKYLGKKIGLLSIQLKKQFLVLEFSGSAGIGRAKIESWVTKIPEKLEFKYARNFIIQIALKEDEDRAEAAKNILRKMQD